MFCALPALKTYTQVSISNDQSLPAASAMLDIQSVTKGLLIPRMTAVQMNAIANPATGLMVFCTDDNLFYFNQGTGAAPSWPVFNSQWKTTGSGIGFTTGNVGIGTLTPLALLSIGSNSQLQINATGNIIRINDVITNWPSAQGASGSFLQNDGSGNLTWTPGSASGVKQIIRGTKVLTSNSTINQNISPDIVPSKSVVSLRHVITGAVGSVYQITHVAIVSALDNNTITFKTTDFAVFGAATVTLEYEIIEYY